MDDIALLRMLDSCHKDDAEEIHGIVKEGLESNKNSWLVNTLVDYYFHSKSVEALSIIKTLPAVQAEAIFDKLNDSLARKAKCLPALKLLLHMSTAELSWLYQIVKTPLFTSLLKLLKSCKDLVALTFAVYCITSTLALSPVSATPHLPDMFEIFSRLIVWKEVEGEALLPPSARGLFLHLDVGVYRYFLQLYAMFPCSFVNYLRARYGPKGESSIFSKNIESLFSFAHLHPKLISGNIESEKDKKRWSHLEPHDVALMSSDISIDPAISLRADVTTLIRSSHWTERDPPHLHLEDDDAGKNGDTATKRSESVSIVQEISLSASGGPESIQSVNSAGGESLNLGSIKEELEQNPHTAALNQQFGFYEGPQADSQQQAGGGDTASSGGGKPDSGHLDLDDLKHISDPGSLCVDGGHHHYHPRQQSGTLLDLEDTLKEKSQRSSSSKFIWSPLEVMGMHGGSEGVDGAAPTSHRSSITSMQSSNTGSGVASSSQLSNVSSPALEVSGRGAAYAWHHSLQQQDLNKSTYSPTASTHSAYVDDDLGTLNHRPFKQAGAGRFLSSLSTDMSGDRLSQSLPPSHHAKSEGSASSAYSSPSRSYRSSGLSSPTVGKKESGVFSSAWSRLKRAWRGSPDHRPTSASSPIKEKEELFQDFEHISVIDGKAVFSPPTSVTTLVAVSSSEVGEAVGGFEQELTESEEVLPNVSTTVDIAHESSFRSEHSVERSGEKNYDDDCDHDDDHEDDHDDHDDHDGDDVEEDGGGDDCTPHLSRANMRLDALAVPITGESSREDKLSSSLPISPKMSLHLRSHNSLSLPSDIEEGSQLVDPTQQRLRALLRTRRPSFIVDAPSKTAEISASSSSSTTGTPRRVGSLGRLVDSPFALTSRLSAGENEFPESAAKEGAKLTGSEGSHAFESAQFRELFRDPHHSWRTHSTCSTSTLMDQSPVGLLESREHKQAVAVAPPLKPKAEEVVRKRPEKLSPIVILNDYIKMGTMIHHFEADEMPLPDFEKTDWSHFGSCIHQEELAVAECQVALLQSQLLFERYKCQQHIQRNRRLWSTASRAAALSEEVTALERANHLLRGSLRSKDLELAVMQENCRRESDARQQLENRAKKEIQSYYQKTGQLREDNSRSKEELKALSNRNQQLLQKLEESEAKVFYLNNKQAYLQQQILLARDSEDQVALLKKERLVLGELQQQQHPDWLGQASHQRCMMRSSATPTDRATEDELTTLRSEVELLGGELAEVKDQLLAKDQIIANCRDKVEQELTKYKKELEEVKEKLLIESRHRSQANSKLLQLRANHPSSPSTERSKMVVTPQQTQQRPTGHRRTASQPGNFRFGTDPEPSMSLANTSIEES